DGRLSVASSSTRSASTSSLSELATVNRFRERTDSATVKPRATPLYAQWLRQLCLDAGADDVGFCDIDRTELAGERADILRFFREPERRPPEKFPPQSRRPGPPKLT